MIRWRERIVAVVIGVTILGGLYFDGRRTAGWIRERRAGPKPFDRFLQECVRTIPADASVLLMPGDDGLIAAARLYPRPVRILDRASGGLPPPGSAAEWIVTYPDPFEPARASVVRAREPR